MLRCGAGRRQRVKAQGSNLVIQQQNPQKRCHSPQNGDGQVGVGGPPGPVGLGMNHQHIGQQGHEFKKEEGREKIGGQKHAQHRQKRQHPKGIELATAAFMAQVLCTGKRGHQPAQYGQAAQKQLKA